MCIRILQRTKDGNDTRCPANAELVSPAIFPPRHAADDVVSGLFFPISSHDLLSRLIPLGAPRHRHLCGKTPSQQIPGPYPALTIRGRFLRHLVTDHDVLFPCAQQSLHAQLLVAPPGRRVSPKTSPVVAIHQPQLAVQAADEHGPAVAREVQTRNARANHVSRAAPHAHVVAPHATVDAADDDLGAPHDQSRHGVARLAQHLDGPEAAAPGVPDARRGVEAAAHDKRVALAGEADAVDARRVALGVSPKAARRRGRRHVPEEDGPVSAARHEALIVRRHGQAQHLVPVRGVGLYKATLGSPALLLRRGWPHLGDRRAGEGVVQPDVSVRRPGENVGPWRCRICDGMDRTCILGEGV